MTNTKQLENIALIDMDGTLADYTKSVKQYMEMIKSPEETDSDDYDHSNKPWVKNRSDLIKSLPGFWSNLEKINVGFRVLEAIVQVGFTPHVLTKAPKNHTNACTEKMDWCRKHLPDVGVTITEDKGLTYGKILFDDWTPYMLRWLEWRPRGLGIMLNQPWNVGFKHPNVFIVDQNNYQKSLTELYPLLVKAYQR